MNAEPRKYQLTEAGRRLARDLNNPQGVPIYDQEFDLIGLIVPANLQLATFQAWYREVIDESIAEDAARESGDSWADYVNSPDYPKEHIRS